MQSFTFADKMYKVDDMGFLVNFQEWDEDFALGLAQHLNITHDLTKEHWEVINYLRKTFEDSGKCPNVYETCRMMGFGLRVLKRLFPTGYLRGACKLAGITYKEGFLGQSSLPKTAEDLNVISANKVYQMDVRGFLVEPNDWDEYYAVFRAHDMKIPGGKLTDKHWQVIHYIRECFKETGQVPTVYQVCEANGINIEEMETLFPDGYHRGAVKIAGLRVR